MEMVEIAYEYKIEIKWCDEQWVLVVALAIDLHFSSVWYYVNRMK